MSLTIRRARRARPDWSCPSCANSPNTKSCCTKSRRREADIDAALFGANPRVFCEIAEWDGEPAGFAVWFVNFSTFSGRSGIYLEDLFVRPALRGKGIGKALLVHLARQCVAERLVALAVGGARLEHAVDRILQIARRGPDGRVDDVPGRRSRRLTALAQERADGDRARRRGRRERRDRARRRDSVAAQVRHAALPGADDGQADRDGPQDLRLDRRGRFPDAPTSWSPATPAFAPTACVVTHSFTDAKAIATGDALRRFATEIAVIGGAEIYAQWMDIADRLEITEVHARPDGDTRFRPIDHRLGRGGARAESGRPEDSADFSYVTYRRRK